jgi:diacylglycerol kinase (ATP)
MEAILSAFFNSMRGFAFALRSERAVRQEFILLAVAVPVALIISQQIWIRVSLIGVIILTIAIELLNTSIEKLCDHVTPEIHLSIGKIKDLGSAAVFCMIVLTAMVWGTAFLEYWSN